RYAHELEAVAGSDVFERGTFHFTGDVSESIRLTSISGAVILAGSGMCEGGRIRHHLLHNLHRRESTVLFVGYQAEGTLGRVILAGAERVRMSGADVRGRAQMRRIDHHSAHAAHAD